MKRTGRFFCTFAIMIATTTILLVGCEPQCTDTGLPGAWQQDFDFEYGLGQSVLQMNDGGYLIVGGVTPPHGAFSPELLRVDSAGEELWSHQTWGPVYAEGAVELDDGSIIIVGNVEEQGDVARLDADGEVIWARFLEEMEENPPYLSHLVSTSDGHLAALSHSHYSLPREISIVKFDQEANAIWTRKLNVGANDYVRGVVPTEEGGVTVLTSTSLRRLADDGATVWDVVLRPGFLGDERIAVTDDDGVAILGDDRIACFDMNGDVRWDKAYASALGTEPIDFRATPDGGFIVGSSTYSYDFPTFHIYCQNMVLTKLDGSGDISWEREYSTESISFLNAVAPTSDGGYIILGSRGESYFSSWSFMFLLKADGVLSERQ